MEEDKTIKEEFMNLNFFEKVWYSISKFEKYPEMAALGVKKALIYFIQIIAIFCIVYTAIYLYYIANVAEYETDDLTLSGKIVEQLIDTSKVEDNNEYFSGSIEYLQNVPISTMVATLFVSIFISIFLTTLIDVLSLSMFGLITCFFSRISIKYQAMYNMSIYALTLSIILKLIYLSINLIFKFEIKYFDIMYIAVAYISLAAAIFMIKSDLIKQHIELIKVMEESKQKIEEKIKFPKKQKEEKEDETKEESEKDKENKDNQEEKSNGTEEQGSNA